MAQDILSRLKKEGPMPSAAAESPMGESMEMEMEEEVASPIADMDNEELVAELEKRGIDVSAIRSQLSAESDAAAEEDSGDSMPMEMEDDEEELEY